MISSTTRSTLHHHDRPAVDDDDASRPAKRARPAPLGRAAAADAANNAAAHLLTCDEAAALVLESPPSSPSAATTASGSPAASSGASSAASAASAGSALPPRAAAALAADAALSCAPPRTRLTLDAAALANPRAVALAFGFSDTAARVGAGYFRRLARGDVPLAAAARRSPGFAALLAGGRPALNVLPQAMPRCASAPPLPGAAPPPSLPPSPPPSPPSAAQSRFGFAPTPRSPAIDGGRLMSVYLACVHVAAKCVERVPYTRLLPAMLTWANGGVPVPPAAAACAELDVLQALEWRLGPFLSAPAEVM